MKFRITLAAAVTVTALTLAGCTATATPEPEETLSTEPVTLEVMSTTIVGNPEGGIEQKIADAFHAEHPNITIKFIGVASNDYNAKITSVATSGDVPDVFNDGPELAARLYDLGITEDLAPLLGKDFLKGFQQTVLKQGYIDKTLQFVPFYTIPQGILYRKDLFDAAGLKPPTTWDEFVKVAQALTVDTNADGQIDRWGFGMIGTANGSGGSRFVPVMHTFGGSELTKDGDTYTAGFDDKGSVAALQLYGDLVNKYQVVPPGVLQTSFPEAVTEFSTDKVAMMITGPNGIGAILAQNPKLSGLLASAPLPAAAGEKSATVLGQGGWAISATSKHKKEAAEYIKYFLSKDNQVAWNLVTGRLPVRTDAAESPLVNRPELEGYLKSIDGAFQLPAVPYYPNVQIIAAKAYQAVISGTPAADAAKDANKLITTEIENNG